MWGGLSGTDKQRERLHIRVAALRGLAQPLVGVAQGCHWWLSDKAIVRYISSHVPHASPIVAAAFCCRYHVARDTPAASQGW